MIIENSFLRTHLHYSFPIPKVMPVLNISFSLKQMECLNKNQFYNWTKKRQLECFLQTGISIGNCGIKKSKPFQILLVKALNTQFSVMRFQNKGTEISPHDSFCVLIMVPMENPAT